MAAFALLDATVDATANVAPRTMTTTKPVPRKMRHANPNFGGGSVRIAEGCDGADPGCCAEYAVSGSAGGGFGAARSGWVCPSSLRVWPSSFRVLIDVSVGGVVLSE